MTWLQAYCLALLLSPDPSGDADGGLCTVPLSWPHSFAEVVISCRSLTSTADPQLTTCDTRKSG